jgi:hypothetical protein
MGIATAVLLASVGMAAAQPRYHLRTDQFYSTHQGPNQVAPSRWDRIRYDHSEPAAARASAPAPGIPKVPATSATDAGCGH